MRRFTKVYTTTVLTLRPLLVGRRSHGAFVLLRRGRIRVRPCGIELLREVTVCWGRRTPGVGRRSLSVVDIHVSDRRKVSQSKS
jgi:hypothetical protein